jgi:hypothetical protein
MKLITSKDTLTVDFIGQEQFWAFCNKLIIPKQDITDIRWHSTYEKKEFMWRVFGTGAPGFLYAGYFRNKKHWEFLYIRRPKGWTSFTAKEILDIRLAGSKYERMLLSCDAVTAKRLQTWLASK